MAELSHRLLPHILIAECPLLALSGHELVRRTRPLVTQSGRRYRRAENVFFQSEIHMLQTQHWSGIRDSIKAIMAPPGARACWSEIKSRVNPEFRSFVDGLIAEQT